MTTIATTNPSIGSALAELISSGSNASGALSAGAPSTAGSSGSSTKYGVSPATNVTLSDQAKATLAKAQADQVAAQRLAAQVAAGRSGKTSAQPATPESFEQIVASAKQSQTAASSAQAQASSNGIQPTGSEDRLGDELDSQLQSLFAAHKNADGSFNSFSVTERDVTVGPPTQDDQNEWYASVGTQGLVANAQFVIANPIYTTPDGVADAKSFLQAYQNHTIVLQSASDVPDLNFHNSVTLQGGEGGGSINGSFTYNKNAAIFQDPTTYTTVDSDGLVMSFKITPPTSNASGS